MAGRPRPDTSIEKKCSGCKETKPRSEFHRAKRTFDNLQTRCKECSRAQSRQQYLRVGRPDNAARSRAWRAANPRLAKDYKLKSTYGVPLGWYDATLAKQNGRCAICTTTDSGGRGDFHLDHCHDTGSVRGLLCSNCNVGIGHFRHSKELLVEAIRYLAESRGHG